MNKQISLFLAFAIATISVPARAQTEGSIVPPQQVPSDVPEWHRQEWYQYPTLPVGWNAITPTGGAITTSGNGTIEIKSFKLICDVPGSKKQMVFSDTQSIGAGMYLRNPWFGNNDYHEEATISRTSDGTVILDVPYNRVLHWWTNSRGIVPEGTNNCSAEALVRATGNVIAALGGNWWKTPTAEWAGFNVNNKEIGNGDWYYSKNWQWQFIRMEPD